MSATSRRRIVPDAVWHDLVAAVEVADRFPGADMQTLANALYAEWYLCANGEGDGGPPRVADAVGRIGPVDLNLPDVLCAAHADARRWSSGWTVEGLSTRGRVAVTRNGRSRIVARVDALPDGRPCLPPRRGDQVRVVARRDAFDPASGFWFAYGGDWDESTLPAELIRVYWHVPRRATPRLVRVLTGGLRRTGCSYSLKVSVEDRDVERPDRAVLYLTWDELGSAADEIRHAHRELEPELRSGVPRLTFRLGKGLSLAEDPSTGESFGQHRCRLVAEATATDGGRRTASVAARASIVIEQLAGAGIDPARPYLRPGSDRETPWPST